MLSGGKPPFPTCEFSLLDRFRVVGVVPRPSNAAFIFLLFTDPPLFVSYPCLSVFIRGCFFLSSFQSPRVRRCDSRLRGRAGLVGVEIVGRTKVVTPG